MTATVMIRPSAEFTTFDEAAARREGWVILGCGVDESGCRRVELQRLDNSGPGEDTFSDDLTAWLHVAERARQGSVLHLQAFALIDPIERALIEQHVGRL